MARSLRAAAVAVLLFVVALPCQSGWGENADRMITNAAVDTLPDEMRGFFTANRQFLVHHATVVEESEPKGSSESHNGFIQLDHYGAFPFAALPRSYNAAVTKYGRAKVDTYGLLPWQVGLYSKKLTDAFRNHDWQEARVSAAILAHYVCAAHNPFNTTMNGDGKLSDQPGVNERFSTGLVDRYQLFFFIKPNEAAFIRDPTEHAFDMTLSAHSWLENVLLADRRAHEGLGAYNDEYYDRFYSQAGAVLIRQLTDAATDVGSYWMSAWINAGRPPLPPQ